MVNTETKKRAADDSCAGAGARGVKRLRLNCRKSASSSSSTTLSSNKASNGNPTALPVTMMIEAPTGEQVEAAEVFPSHIVRDPSKHWTSSTFNLDFPALTNRCSLLLRYTWAYERDASDPAKFRPTCWPDTPADTITKKLFVHKNHRNITWSGKWAEEKLAAEIQRYERVKWFWLFNEGYLYFHGCEDKYYYVSRRFKRELESQWVVAWLGELIGEEELGKILAHVDKVKKEEEEE